MKNRIISIFNEVFNSDPRMIAFSPGRINLMGEHLDYNGGNVLPCAISLGIYGAISFNSSSNINLYSHNVRDGISTYNLNKSLENQKKGKWSDYIAGVIWALRRDKKIVLNEGFNMIIYGDLPNSSGLSSSAALETLAIFLINELYGLNLSKFELVLLAKKCENDFINVKCGVMDQFSVIFGKKNKAIFLDTQDINKFKYVSFKSNDYSLLIVNSNLRRNLISSKYNERYDECQKIVEFLNSQNNSKYKYICDIAIEKEGYYISKIPNDTLKKRFQHVVEENERTKKSIFYLENNDFSSFGQIMYDSHNSLKNLYEVSCDELNEIVSIASTNGAIGARMTGAGFGGCVIILTKINNALKIGEEVKKGFLKKFHFSPSIYVVGIVDGTHLL